jgi:uncharacterized protein YjiS (DUF1127 family)
MTVGASYPLKLAARLVHRLWRVTIAIKHRQALARLAERDDRMLADIGLSRGDLYYALFAPYWVDPTAILQQRARRRCHEADRGRSDSSHESLEPLQIPRGVE